MKRSLLLVALLSVVCISASAQTLKEITKDNLPTLIGMKSTQLSVLGFNLTMTRAQAEAVMKNSKTLLKVADEYNPGRIYVASKNPDGADGKDLLYLIWDGNDQMQQITVFEDTIDRLAPNFKRLLTFEKNASKEKTDFIMSFVGRPDRTDITLDIPLIGTRHTTYFYDAIGFEITNKVNRDKSSVVFALTQPNLKKKK